MKILRALIALAPLTLAAAPALAETVLPPDDLASPGAGQNPAAPGNDEAGPIDPRQPLEFKKDVSRSFGNDNWGGGYRLYENARAPSLGFQSINVDYYAKGHLFGKEMVGFDFNSATWNPSDTQRASAMQVVVANQELFNDRKSSTDALSTTQVGFNKLPFDKTIFSASHRFMLGPIPVNVSGDVKGSIGVNVQSKAYRDGATSSGVSMNGTAFAKLTGSMSAGVDILFASAGIKGSVVFAEVRAAKNISLDRDGFLVRYNNDFTTKLSSLSGELSIYASAFGADYSKVILDWDGYSTTYTLADESATINFTPVFNPVIIGGGFTRLDG